MIRVNDSATSPVVGVVLMIAVTVALSFGVLYAFEVEPVDVDSISVNGEGRDFNDNSGIDHVGLMLRSSNAGELKAEDYRIQLTYDSTEETLEPSESWEVGETKWFPCLANGNHLFNIVVNDKVAESFALHCDEAYEKGGENQDENSNENLPEVVVYPDCDKILPKIEEKVSEIVDFCIRDVVERVKSNSQG